MFAVNTVCMVIAVTDACRVISHPAATVIEAEDQAGRVWALKRIQGDRQSVREAERMVKLRDHPLVVHLESVFLDGQAIYLQMPFYKHGNLRTWVEQIKVHCCVSVPINTQHICHSGLQTGWYTSLQLVCLDSVISICLIWRSS